MPKGIYNRNIKLSKDQLEENEKVYFKKYYYKNKISLDEKYRTTAQKRRIICLKYYSGEIPFCACCNEKHLEFLSIDHVNGGGTKHRKEMHITNLYQWLFTNDCPVGFQVLCHNCNMAKGFYGKCPHKDKHR